jgi:hypothetical protein
MKKTNRRSQVDPERDTMRKEYDFSGAVRGVTAARYAQGANVVVIDPEVLDVFPDSSAVNEALRALAPVLRRQRASKTQIASNPIFSLLKIIRNVTTSE